MKSLLVLLILGIGNGVIAQSVGKKIEQRTNQRVDQKVDQGINKGLDKAEEAIGNIFKKKDKKKKGNETDSTRKNDTESGSGTSEKQAGAGSQNGNKAVKAASDFIPGANVIFEDHFEKDAVSDFPALWNSNGNGSVTTVQGVEGKWLDISHNSTVNPVLDKPLPENCTIEFDLFLQASGEQRIPIILFGLTPVKDILKEDLYYSDKFYTSLAGYKEAPTSTIDYGLKYSVGNKNDFKLSPYVNKVLHVSMSINKTRVRVYLDQTKIIDLPKALTPAMRNNFFITNGFVIPASELGVLVSNLRIASSETDARSLLIKQLMDEGKAVTSDILFDVNSDVIKPESYKIINQFGEALQANPGLKIKITGHTDSDGTAANNLTLSKKRAAAVRIYLIENYGVDQSRITTDGKGASLPVAPNTSSEGKTKNRRVEFTKVN